MKVLIIDDEKLERVLIRKGYNWEENGFEVIGEAASAQEALDMIKVNVPDIVLTDINMPNMNGLQFVGKALELYKDRNIKFVIITGYRDFEYARQAVKLGVEDYILKPISIEDLSNTMNKLKELIQKTEQEKNEISKLKETLSINIDIVKESFLQRLVENRISEQEALNKLKGYGYQGLEQQCICCNIRIDYKQEHEEEKKIKQSREILNLIGETQIDSLIMFVHYLGNVILYFTNVTEEQLIEKLKKLEETLKSHILLPTNIGVSRRQKGFEGIHKAYLESDKALSARIMIGQNQCIHYEDYVAFKKTINLTEMDWEDFIFSVQNCLEAKVEGHVKKYMKLIQEANNFDLQWLKFMTVNILTKGELTLHKHGMSLSGLEGTLHFSDLIDQIDSIEYMQDVIFKSLQAIMDYHKSIRPRKGKQIVGQALKIITENLYNSQLSLTFVADKIFTNDSYLSRIFKQEMNDTLINYIIKKRIEESIHLLNTTDLKVYEIAEKVGINDPHYFSICFKKQVGVTIKEYKNLASKSKR